LKKKDKLFIFSENKDALDRVINYLKIYNSGELELN